MRLRFRPLNESELVHWQDDLARRYVESKKTALGYTEDEAVSEANALFAHALSKGTETPGQFVLAIELEGEKAGWTWFGLVGQSLFIYDLCLLPHFRGKGFGPEALDFIRQQGRELGALRTVFQVFAHNTEAFAVFGNYGFRVASHSLVLEN